VVPEYVLVEVLAAAIPNQKRPSSIAAEVAVAWAIIAGWMRMVGQVTPVPRRIFSVAEAIPPITLHTNALSPCASIQGW
jgi:hypothetical protein